MKKSGNRRNPHLGESFDSFLKAEGIYRAVTAAAIRRALAKQLERAMKQQRLTKTQMARRIKISRAQLDLLLGPENDDVSLATLRRTATILTKILQGNVEPRPADLNPAIDLLRR